MRCLVLKVKTPMHVVQRIQAAFKRRSKRLRRKSAPAMTKSKCASDIAALVIRHPWMGLEKFESKQLLRAAAVRRNLGL